MFAYYFKLGVRSLRRNPALTALMILTLAVGVAASIATLTILHVMSSNPIPQKSERLFTTVIDNGALEGYNPNDDDKMRNDQLSYIDAMNVVKGAPAVRKAALYGLSAVIEPPRADMPAMSAVGMATARDFFGMMDVPFLHGQPWSETDEQQGGDVAVISRALGEKLFGAVNPVGRRIRLNSFDYQITGVMDNFLPVPKFYRLIGAGAFSNEEEILIPMANAVRHESSTQGNMSCSGKRDAGFQGLLRSECTWVQIWLETRTASDRAELQNWLDSYAADQRKLGRLKRQAPNRVYDVMQWLEHRKVVGNDNRLAVYLAFGFLVLCLVNTVGLLLAKFSVRAAEVGIRRALGASRRVIFQQFLIETGVIGLAGAVLGLLLAFGALALIGMQSTQLKVVAHLDWEMLGLTVLLSLAASLVAGLLPTWRACQVTPAIQLKSQ